MEDVLEVKAIIDPSELAELKEFYDLEEVKELTEKEEIDAFLTSLDESLENKKIRENEEKKQKRKEKWDRIRIKLLVMGKTLVKAAIAIGAAVGLINTLIPVNKIAVDIATWLAGLGVVGQLADTGAKMVETMKTAISSPEVARA